MGERDQGRTAKQEDTCFPIFPPFYPCLYIYFFTRKAAPLGEESGFCLPCKVRPLFKGNSAVQHKQTLLKTFSSKTIATTFDVSTALTLPHCLIIMFYNIFSPSSQAPFQVPQLWNSWLHHPKPLHSRGTQWKEFHGVYFDWEGCPSVPVFCTASAGLPVAGLKELSSRGSSPSIPGIPSRALLQLTSPLEKR